MKKELIEIRQAIADYMRAEGCSCCRQEEEQEQLAELRSQLKELGFSTRAISAAFKNIGRKEE